MKDCYVYIVARSVDGRLEGPVKVGITENVQSRLKSLQTGHPYDLQVAAQFVVPNRDVARDLERAFHGVKARHRLRGEWFDLSVTDAIRFMCANIRAGLEVHTNLDADETEHALWACGVITAEAELWAHLRPSSDEAAIQ